MQVTAAERTSQQLQSKSILNSAVLQASNAKVKQMNDCTNALTGKISNLADQQDVLEVCCVLEVC